MKNHKSQQFRSICRYFTFVAAVSLWNVVPSSAQPVQLTPGSTTTIEIAGTTVDCSEVADVSGSNVQQFWIPNTGCLADQFGDQQLKVFAVSAFSTGVLGNFSSLQNLNSTAKLIREITIPKPVVEPFLSTLRVQVATEVTWSGGLVAAGVASTYGQIIATLQVRDVTAAPTGPVVASNTFFSERFDAQLDLPTGISLGGVVEALNLVDTVDVSNTSGADVTAFLERGRTYAIELEAKCDVGAPAIGFAFCVFAGSAVTDIGGTGLPSGNPFADVFADDGFQVAPFEVTVESDPVQDAINQL